MSRLRLLSFTRRLFMFGTKVGLVGGAVYYSKELGVWNDSSKSEELYKELYSLAAPYIKEIPVEVPQLPKASDFSEGAKYYWNHGVVAVSEFLVELPDKSAKLTDKCIDYIKSQMATSSKQ